MHVIHRHKFIIKIAENISHINQFTSRVQNFISLNFKEKSMRYAIFPNSKHLNLKSQEKNVGRLRWVEGFMCGVGLSISNVDDCGM